MVILFAISLHESAHAWAADRFGDPTAKLQGRITLNPIPHIDPIGTIIFPGILILMGLITGGNVLIFGWAKPVMVNPYNLRDPRRDGMFISAAGPFSNVLTAVIGIFVFLLLKSFGIVNLIGGGSLPVLTFILYYLILLSVLLAIFNMIPVPPLDGSGIIEGLLKGEALRTYQKIKPFGFLILIMILYTGILNVIFHPIMAIIEGILI